MKRLRERGLLRAMLAGIAEPGAEPDIEERHHEGERRRGVIAHIGARCRAGDGDRGAERDAVAAEPVGAPTIFLRRAIGAALLLLFLFGIDRGAAAMQRRNGEGGGLALLPGEILGRNDVERDIDDMKDRPLLGGGLEVPELLHAEIVAVIEIGEAVDLLGAHWVARPEKGADETVAIEGVEREAVDVDEGG